MKIPKPAPTAQATDKIRLIYILAASHSGSTLLAMLLGAHDEICTVGELKATSLGDAQRYRCSCLQLISRCRFWRDVTAAMAVRGFAFTVTQAGTSIHDGADFYQFRLLKPLHRGPYLEALRDGALALSPRWRSRSRHLQALNAALMESVLECSGKRVIVDSSKIGLRLKYLLRDARLDVRVLRLIRDGRGVALTYVNPSDYADASDPAFRDGGRGTSKRGGVPMAEAARRWRRCNEEADALLRQIDPTRSLELRYEALCTHPEASLRKVFDFIGVAPSRYETNFRKIEHHVIGNGMRMDSTAEIRLDERWRSVMTSAQLSTFDAVAGNLNRRYGYE